MQALGGEEGVICFDKWRCGVGGMISSKEYTNILFEMVIVNSLYIRKPCMILFCNKTCKVILGYKNSENF